MRAMTSSEKAKVLIDGKLVTMEELLEQYKGISVARTPVNVQIMQYLSKTKRPLTRQDVAKEVKKTTGYASTLLKRLFKEGLVLEFNMKGSNFKYYLLTEEGYNLLKTVEE